MEKRRKRINNIKKTIVFAFLFFTIIPSVVSIYLLNKVSALEEEVTLIEASMDSDTDILMSSSLALASNPYAQVDVIGTEQIKENTIIGGEQAEEDTSESIEAEKTVKRVYLTFDDGPCKNTNEILDILAANNIKATFFVIGRDEERFWPIYKRIVDEGHTIGMHTYTHDFNTVYSSVDAFADEITRLSDLIYNVTGERPKYVRFPGGSSNTITKIPIENFIEYLDEQGFEYYDWNALNGDAVSGSELSVDQLINNVMSDVHKNGDTSIILMHDMQNRHTTIESLQPLIDILQNEGYEILPIDDSTVPIQHVKFENENEEN